MKKFSFTLLMSLLIAGLATAAFAWGGGPGMGGHGRGPGYGPCGGDHMAALSQLNLTAEQMEKIRALKESFLKETKPLRDKMFSKRGDLRLLWLEKSPDQDKILAAKKELRILRDQMEDKMTAQRLAVFNNVLTPEQQNKARALMAKRHGHGPGMMGHGPGMGSGMGPCAGPEGCPGGGPGGAR